MNLKVYSIDAKRVTGLEVLTVGSSTLTNNSLTGLTSLKTDSITANASNAHPFEDNRPAFAAIHETNLVNMTFVATGVTGNSVTLAAYPTVKYNWNNMFNATTGLATIPVKGLYQFNVNLSLNNNSITHYDLTLIINGLRNNHSFVCEKPSTGWGSACISTTINLNAGDTVGAYVSYVNVSGTLSCSTQGGFDGFLVKRL